LRSDEGRREKGRREKRRREKRRKVFFKLQLFENLNSPPLAGAGGGNNYGFP